MAETAARPVPRRAPDDRPTRTLLVALVVSLVCAGVVSTTAIVLRPLQVANRKAERERHIRAIIERLPGAAALFEGAEGRDVEARVVELATGRFVDAIDAQTFDQRAAAKDPGLSTAIPRELDIADIERRARYATVFLVTQAGELRMIILPVHGSGYASTMYGFVALEADANTVVALSFFEHEETPGMGAKIDDPTWRAKWLGKKVRDGAGRLRIGVSEGAPSAGDLPYHVDGISGATFTSEGVSALLRYWLGDHGFGPFLAAIRT